MIDKSPLYISKILILILSGTLFLNTPPTRAQEKLKQTFQTQNSINSAAQQSQTKINKLADSKGELLAEYRMINRQIDNLNIYNKQLEKYITSQNKEVISLKSQIAQIDDTAQNLIPLMIKMIKALDEFVKLDIPFYPQERSKRITNLYSMMDASDINSAEKYRRILEAYTIENDYGREAVSSKGILDDGRTETTTVNFLRLGRLAYVYLTLDEKQAGFWDKQKRQWSELPTSYIPSFRQGIKITQKRAIPNMIKLPVLSAKTQ